ncbi:MAG: CDP-diacylglycerol diphosphatase [Reyranellaceae bacterium]
MRPILLAASIGLLCTISGVVAARADQCVVPPAPNALWALAQCCMRSLANDVGCRVYDKADDYIILKDNAVRKPRSYMIIPTIRVTGIEDRLVARPPTVDFWQYGWAQSRTYPGYPMADTGLAINSQHGRTENQLHIHISCVRPDVKQALDHAAIELFPAQPVTLRLPPHDHLYRAVKVSSLAGKQSPFLVFQTDRQVKDDMGRQSIAVVGSRVANEYFVLDTSRGDGNPGVAEELLDQTCMGVPR